MAAGLPLLDAMLNGNGTALAATGAPVPLRFGVFYWAGGVVHRDWVPQKTGFDWELPPALASFADLRPYVTLVTGVHHKHSEPGHIPARGIALSSSHDLEWVENVDVGKGFRGQNHPEPSIDALVAEHWKGKTLFDSLEVGICRKGPYRSNSSWKRGGRVFNRHEPSPQRLFTRLFQREPTADERQNMLMLSAKTEASMLDGLAEEARRLSRRLGTRDRQRLEQHMEGLRAIERRLHERERLRAHPAPFTCATPSRPERADYGDGTGREEKEAKSRDMSHLLAVALACDLTRVFSYEWSATQSHAVYWETGARMEHHPMNHAIGDTPEYASTIRFIMKNYAGLAEQLRQMPEGDGNVLDNTLILGTSEHASARKHNYQDHPFLLLGKAGGKLRAGQHHREACDTSYKAPRVLLSAVRAVGVPIAKLGQEEGPAPRAVTEGLGAIET
jgi:hypothetical protein